MRNAAVFRQLLNRKKPRIHSFTIPAANENRSGITAALRRDTLYRKSERIRMLPVFAALWFALLPVPAATPQPAPTMIAQADAPAAPVTPPVDPAKAAHANPDASGKYHVGDGVKAPKQLNKVDVAYPEAARNRKIQGVTTLSLTVDVNGRPNDVRIIESLAKVVQEKDRKVAQELDQEAVSTVMKYQYAPAIFQGKPVPVEIEVKVGFQPMTSLPQSVTNPNRSNSFTKPAAPHH